MKRSNLALFATCFAIFVLDPRVHAATKDMGPQRKNATWDLNPASDDWNTAANWTPDTVPLGTATFGESNITNVTSSLGATVTNIVFTPEAPSFDISFMGTVNIVAGAVTNNSAVTQHFELFSALYFDGASAAGSNVIYTIRWSTTFFRSSNAGSATFLVESSNVVPIAFQDDSSAASSSITVNAGTLLFGDHATAAQATLIADGGTIDFNGGASGGTPRIILSDGGALDVNLGRSRSSLVIGSLEGDGDVNLGASLVIGGNGLDTVFSGQFVGSGRQISVTKTGSGTLTLEGDSPDLTGGFAINDGTLVAANTVGSATGTGPVIVNAGTLAGNGLISGEVTVGTGSGAGVYLAPGGSDADTLTLQASLTFAADGVYQCDLKLKKGTADEVTCDGASIGAGAQFAIQTKGNQVLASGTVFTVINNTTINPISGTFANLPDGGTITAGPNTLRANYEGGDGNDLTFTVL